MSTLLTARIPDDLGKRLEYLAQRTGRTKAFYLRKALEETLEDMEDAYLGEIAYTEFVQSKEKAISHEDIKKALDLDS